MENWKKHNPDATVGKEISFDYARGAKKTLIHGSRLRGYITHDGIEYIRLDSGYSYPFAHISNIRLGDAAGPDATAAPIPGGGKRKSRRNRKSKKTKKSTRSKR